MSEAKVQGVVHLIEETKTYGQKGFRKRLVVLEQDKGRFVNYIPVEFIHKAGLAYSEKPVRYDGAMRYTRPLNHLNPVMTSIAKEIGYKPISMGEDRDYSIRLAESGLVKDDCLVNDYLYFYQYRSKK